MFRPTDGERTSKPRQEGREGSNRPLSSRRLSGPSFWGAIAVLLIPGSTFAQRGGGPPITLTFESVSGGLPVGGAGTNIASLNFGNVSAYKTLGPGVTRTSTSTDYTISTLFGVRVTKVGGPSPNYTLRARLVLAHALTWQVNGVTMSTAYATLANTQPYASTLSHSLAFVVPLTYAAGLVTTQFEVLTIAN